ncbi:uncharacterized protein LOC141898708 [Tubulanus polymorphus]|uniref:uncharacterized protein LOC141898708 n=1 Tax=Tubulanus polymorphus TaxID=672921 RepID=UPI003DA49719
MGGAVSQGENNDELIDNLAEADYIKTPNVEKVFRAVDRAMYYLPDHRESAYKDLAWKHGNLHLSAPCIYSEVMESLKLEPGLSFLNLGSGTGYLSTMAGLLIGPYGVNHGVELHADVVDYANERVEEFKKSSDSFEEFEFCPPKFVIGNCLLLSGNYHLYDRVYCGAACPPEHENYMKNLIKIGGILVIPINDQLLQITRTREAAWETKTVLPVSFASLVLPLKTKTELVELPDNDAMKLQDISRLCIRRILCRNIRVEHPQNDRKRRKKPKRRRLRHKRVNMVPMNMGMMILGNFDSDSDDSETNIVGNGETGSEETHNDTESGVEHDTNEIDIDIDDDTPEPSHDKQSSDTPSKDLYLSKYNGCCSASESAINGQGSCNPPHKVEKPESDNLNVKEHNDEYSTSPGKDSTHSNAETSDTSGHGTMYSCSDRSTYSSSAEVSPSTSVPDHDPVEGAVASMSPIEEETDSEAQRLPIGDISELLRLRLRGERRRCISHDDDEDDDEEDSETMDCSDQEISSIPEVSFRFYMKEKVDLLPIPQALKQYLCYYRN